MPDATSSPEHGVTAEVNAPAWPPAGWVELYTPAGAPVLVREADAAAEQQRQGLLTVQYDLAAAIEEWHAAYKAREATILDSLKEMMALGYQRNESVWIMNEVTGRERDAWSHLVRAVGAKLPTEDHIGSLAMHRDAHGTLDNLPEAQQALGPLVDTYLAQPEAALPEHSETEQAAMERAAAHFAGLEAQG